MNCPDVQRLLNPFSDGELDLVRHLQVEGHLAECPTCAQQAKNLRTLRETVGSRALYARAPASLRERIAVGTPVARVRHARFFRFAATAAGIFLVLAAVTAIGLLLYPAHPSAEDRLAEWVVAGHVRSLQLDHLMDVPSSDQHTVKPWFRGKLDFAPQVPDLAADDFRLAGGRLDYLVDHPAAAIVYYRRLHAINLFMWTAASDNDQPVRRQARQGFHLRFWQRSGIAYCAISDLNDQELDEFVELFQKRSRP